MVLIVEFKAIKIKNAEITGDTGDKLPTFLKKKFSNENFETRSMVNSG